MLSKSNRSPQNLSFLLFLLLFSSESFASAYAPVIKISGVNATTVKKYEKFEVSLLLERVEFENPFDPADIDVYAEFTAPSGKLIHINGFYDNYMGANQWKVRFSPGETGNYTYQLFVDDSGMKGESAEASFTAIDLSFLSLE